MAVLTGAAVGALAVLTDAALGALVGLLEPTEEEPQAKPPTAMAAVTANKEAAKPLLIRGLSTLLGHCRTPHIDRDFCHGGQYAVTVRDVSGSILWTTHVDGFNALTLYVSPNGQAVSDGRNVETRSGGMVSLPQGFVVDGWLDNDTVMGRQYIGNGPDVGDLLWIRLSQPTKINDLGFKGDFVGTLD